MNAELAALPDDIDALKTALLAARAEAAAAIAQCSSDQALIAHLKLEIAKLNRDRFGPRSERTARLGCVPIVSATVRLIRSSLEGLDHGGTLLAERRTVGID